MDIRHRSPDAEYILEKFEFDLPWKETQISPKTAIKDGLEWRRNLCLYEGASIPPMLEEPVEDFIKGFLRTDPKRFRAIQGWAGDELREAVHESPILIIKTTLGRYLVDGWHRAALAWEEGLKRITALVLDGTMFDPYPVA